MTEAQNPPATVEERYTTAANTSNLTVKADKGGAGDLLIAAGSSMQMGLAFSGLLVVGIMAMLMYELFSWIEKHTTAWAHRSSQGV